MRFFPAEQRVVVQTYSPYADRFKTDPQNEFTLDTDAVQAPDKTLSDWVVASYRGNEAKP